MAPVIKPNPRPTLLIVAHGERGGARDDRFAHDLVDRIEASGTFDDVQACFLSKEPSLKQVYGALSAGRVVIFPLFMADGYFVRVAIPRALADSAAGEQAGNRPVKLMQPLGLHPQLPQLVAETALDAARTAGADSAAHELLLVAHGSKHDGASKDITERVADSLRAMCLFAGVCTSFLEEVPFLKDQLAAIERPTIAVGLFASQGMHGKGDLPEAVDKSGRHDILLAPPLVESPALADLALAEIERTMVTAWT